MIAFARRCGYEFSNREIILARLIAVACLCPDEQLPNHMKEGENDNASHCLAFLVAFTTWTVSFGEERKN
jgi:hypothetical protein